MRIIFPYAKEHKDDAILILQELGFALCLRHLFLRNPPLSIGRVPISGDDDDAMASGSIVALGEGILSRVLQRPGGVGRPTHWCQSRETLNKALQRVCCIVRERQAVTDGLVSLVLPLAVERPGKLDESDSGCLGGHWSRPGKVYDELSQHLELAHGDTRDRILHTGRAVEDPVDVDKRRLVASG